MKNMKDKNYSFMSFYDSFYSDYYILKKLLGLGDVIKQSVQDGEPFERYVRGYLLFIGYSIIRMTDYFTHSVSDALWEYIVQGEKYISDPEVKELRKKNKEIQFACALDDARSGLYSIMAKDTITDGDIKKIYNISNKTNRLLTNLNDYFVSKHKIKRVNDDRDYEKLVILSNIAYVYNRMLEHGGLSKRGNDLITIIEGPHIHSHLISPHVMWSYSLQNPRIKRWNKEYLEGFKFCLRFLYKHIIPDKTDSIKKDFIRVNSWKTLDKIGIKIYDENIGKRDVFKNIFENKKPRDDDIILREDVISTKKQIERFLGGLDLRVIKARYSGDELNAQPLFWRLLDGSWHNSMVYGGKVKLLEFERESESGHRRDYSYALYIPSTIPHWILFSNIDVGNGGGGSSQFKIILKHKIKMFKRRMQFYSVKIKGKDDLLKRYIDEKDFDTSIEKRKETQAGYARGLIAEFLACLYVSKKFKVTHFDIAKDIKGTEIDVIAETRTSTVIVQSKQSLPSEKKDLEDIIQYFEKVKKEEVNTKRVKKILFVMQDAKTAKELNSWYMIEGFDILKRLKNEKIEVVYFSDLKKILKDNFKGLINRLESVFEDAAYAEYYEYYRPGHGLRAVKQKIVKN